MSEPRIRFVIGGAQKAGTSALAQYLRASPVLRLPMVKEAHVFDAPDFNEVWTPAQIDARYVQHFPRDMGDLLCGDATPIYLFLPQAVQRIARYNPAMRWIVLLRDPVERALSHYHMERSRGLDSWPLWSALLLERMRLLGHYDDLSSCSPLRTHSYRARGDYARQLDVLYAHFPRHQVLLLRSASLKTDPAAALERVWRLLDVPAPEQPPQPRQVFVGDYRTPDRHNFSRRLARWLLRHEIGTLRERYGIVFDE